MSPVYHLTKRIEFPAPSHAHADGLLAVGGDLTTERLLLAYSMGIFPWYNEGDPILWWSPDPRTVLFPEEFRYAKSLRRLNRSRVFRITMDSAFQDVIRRCASAPRRGQPGTWLTREMQNAYCDVHRAGYAHSVECRTLDDELVGGLYGLSIGKCFFGESMFSVVPNASKVAFSALVEQVSRWGFEMIDCQVYNPHLASLGARKIPRAEFLVLLSKGISHDTRKGPWILEDGIPHA